jgi:hypothetical protein
MTSTQPAQAASRSMPAAAGGTAIRELRAVQGTGALGGTNSLPLSDFWAETHRRFFRTEPSPRCYDRVDVQAVAARSERRRPMLSPPPWRNIRRKSRYGIPLSKRHLSTRAFPTLPGTLGWHRPAAAARGPHLGPGQRCSRLLSKRPVPSGCHGHCGSGHPRPPDASSPANRERERGD